MSGKGKGRATDADEQGGEAQTLSPARAALAVDTPSDIGTREGDDSEDEGEAEADGGPTRSQPTARAQQSPSATSPRPGLYTQASQSLVNLRPRNSFGDDTANSSSSAAAAAAAADEAPVLGAKPPLITIPSGEEVGTRASGAVPPKIDLPKGPFSMIGRVPQTPGWAKPPPTPATPGAASRVFWAAKGKDTQSGQQQPMMKRRRSADDLTGMLPSYTPPAPGVYVPRPREDEGRERLPGYWCAVSIRFRKSVNVVHVIWAQATKRQQETGY